MSEPNEGLRMLALPNGVTVVHEPMPWLPSASFTLLVPVGAATDPAGREGAATVLHDWLHRGADDLSSQAFSEKLDGLGVRRGGGAGREYMTFAASLLAESFGEALGLYAAMLRRPRLEPEEFDSARTLAEQELDSLKDNPTQQLFESLTRRYFASGHGNSSYGTDAGLAALSAEGLREDAERRLAPSGVVLSVAGGVGWPEVEREARRLFGDWEGDGLPLPDVEVAGLRQTHLQQDTQQVQIGVAFESVPPTSEHWYEHALALGALSGGMGARLFTEVREKRGLVYSVAAVSRTLRNFGYTLAYAGTTTERADETLDVLLGELRRLGGGVSEAEFERARTGLLSQLVMQGESSGSRAAALARDVFLLGRPRTTTEIKRALVAVELEQVNRYLAERYDPRFTVLTLGAKPLREALSA